MLKPFRLAGLLAVALALFTAPAFAKTSILLFDKNNGSGAHIQITEPVKNLSGSGFNDRTSSVFVVSGEWRLCSNKDYQGDCVTLSQGLHNLGNMSNRVSSLRPVDSGDDSGNAGAVLLFTSKNGGGKSVRLTESKSNLQSQYPEISDRISSVAIFAGQWEFCRQAHYKGGCITLGPGVYNLNKFNDSITSVRKK